MSHDSRIGSASAPAPVIRPLADRLNRHLLRWAAACAVLAIGVQGYTAWRHTASEFNQAVQEVAATHVPLLSASVWDIEPELLRRQLANLLDAPEIAHARLMTSTGHLYEVGDQSAGGDMRQFALLQPGRPEVTIGELRITADRSALYRELAYNVLPSLMALGLLTVAILWRIRLTLQRELQEPLRRLSAHVQALSPQALGGVVQLPRGPGHLRDEIDVLADGFQALQESLARYVQRGERNLEGQVALLTELLDALPNPVFVKSADLIYTHCNRAYEEAFDISREALVGRSVLELPYFPLEARQSFHREDAELISRGGRSQDEVDYRYADGSLRNTLRLRATYRLPDGSVGGLIGTIVDISERRRRERHAIFRRDMFELIAHDAGVGRLFGAILRGIGPMLEARVALLISDTEMAREVGVQTMHVEGWPQLEPALQASPDTWGAALPREPALLPHLESHALGLALGLGGGAGEGASEESTWVAPLRSGSGQFLGAILVRRRNSRGPDEVDQDLLTSTCRIAGIALERARATVRFERLRAEEAESRRQFKMTIDSMQEGYIRAGMDDLTQRVNISLVRMLGYGSQLEMMGMPSKQFYARIEDWRHLVTAVMDKGFVRGLRFQARKRDGSTLWVELSAHQALDTSGRVIGIEGMVRDVSSRIEAEEALQRARDQAQEAANAKGAFLANMSHEIRTPLNAVIGLTELALRTELTPQQRGYLGKVRGAASGLLEILNDVLDAAKIESGRLDIEAIAFDLSEVLDGAAMLVALPVEQKGLRLRVERAPGVPRRLVGDPLRVRQVLLNLLSNACKFTDKGEIVLEVTALSPGGGPDGRPATLRFEVRDSGIGMTPDQTRQLFQPFVQADGSTTRRFGGSGLGLAISRQLVEMMGGRIEVQSQPGQGSTFTVELPFLLADDVGPFAGIAAGLDPEEDHGPRPASQAHVLDPTAWRALRGARVLLVEDNAINRQVATELLTQAGVLVDVALHGGEALERLRSAGPQAYDAVLMDLQMPVMDGYTATRDLRSDPAFRSLPILALTASVMAQDRQRVLQAGMNGHIAKPILPADLFSTLLRWIGPRRGGDPDPQEDDGTPAVPPGEEAPVMRLPALEGLDIARALQQVGGRRGLLVRLLRDFLHDHADDAHRIARALADDDRPAARRIAHTLKSVAGTLAADRLRQDAVALEGRLGDDVPALAPDDAAVQALRDALEPLVRGLREWSASVAVTAPAPVVGDASHRPETTALRPRLDAIQRLLSEMDPEAVDQVERLLEAWPGAPGLAWRLADEASRFDFEAAALTLGELQSTLS